MLFRSAFSAPATASPPAAAKPDAGSAASVSDAGGTSGSDASADTAAAACNVKPTLASLSAEYFAGSCTFGKCHAPPSPAGGLDLSAGVAHAQLVGVVAHHPQAKGAVLVVPGQPEQSFLYQKVKGPVSAGALMPLGETEPYDADCSVAMLRQWILDGAKP